MQVGLQHPSESRGSAEASRIQVRPQRANGQGRIATRRSCESLRGAVTVEALLVMPLLMLLFVGIEFVRDTVLARQVASAESKSCAWELANHGCRSPSPRCAATVRGPVSMDRSGGRATGLEVASELNDSMHAHGTVGARIAIDGGSAISASLSPQGFGSVGGGAISEAISKVLEPALGRLLAGNEFALGTAARGVSRPVILGGGAIDVRGQCQLRCNLEEQGPEMMLVSLWKSAMEVVEDDLGL